MKRIENRKAYFDYNVGKSLMAGLKLVGPQVKAIRAGKISIVGTFVLFDDICHVKCCIDGENSDIQLLLNKSEIKNLKADVQAKGKTVVPIAVYEHNGFMKMDIALCTGKKNYDKRESIKQKDLEKNNYY